MTESSTLEHAESMPPHEYGEYISHAISMMLRDPVRWAMISIIGFFALCVGAWGGYHYCIARAMRGEVPEVTDVLHPFSRLKDFAVFPVVILLSSLLIGVIAFILSLLGPLSFLGNLVSGAFRIALLVAYVALLYLFPLMADRAMSVTDAAKMSVETVRADPVPAILIMFLTGLFSMFGMFLFLCAIPAGAMVLMFAYRRTFYRQRPSEVARIADGAPGPTSGCAPPASAGIGFAQGVGNPGAAPSPASPYPEFPQAGSVDAMPGGTNAPGTAPPASEPASFPSAPSSEAAAAPQAGPLAREVSGGDASGQKMPSPAAATPDRQSTSDDPEEAVSGRTMAMSSVDFERFLKDQESDSGRE